MGSLVVRDRSCTVQYPYDVHLLLELADAMTVPFLFLLMIIGGYHLGRYISEFLLPILSAWAQHSWQVATQRWRREPERPAPRNNTIRSPARQPRAARPPRARSATPLPRENSPLPPGSLAILTPARHPPTALVEALNQYQNRVDRPQQPPDPRTPRSKRPKAS